MMEFGKKLKTEDILDLVGLMERNPEEECATIIEAKVNELEKQR